MSVAKHDPRNENWQTEYGHENPNKMLTDIAVAVARLEEKFDALSNHFKDIDARLIKQQEITDRHETLFTEIATEKRIASLLSKPLMIVCAFVLLAEGGYRIPEIIKMFMGK